MHQQVVLDETPTAAAAAHIPLMNIHHTTHMWIDIGWEEMKNDLTHESEWILCAKRDGQFVGEGWVRNIQTWH